MQTNTYTGTTPVSLACAGFPAAVAAWIKDPFFDLTIADQAACTTECLREVASLIPSSLAAHVAVCEFSSEDNTPTLHIDLWRGCDLSGMPAPVASLKLACEGHWDGGRAYSLQLA